MLPASLLVPRACVSVASSYHWATRLPLEFASLSWFALIFLVAFDSWKH